MRAARARGLMLEDAESAATHRRRHVVAGRRSPLLAIRFDLVMARRQLRATGGRRSQSSSG